MKKFPCFMQERLKREQEEKEHKKKEKAEAHLYTIIKVHDLSPFSVISFLFVFIALIAKFGFLQVARDEDLAEQIGKEIYFDLVDHDKVKCFRIQKQIPFNQFKVLLMKLNIHQLV